MIRQAARGDADAVHALLADLGYPGLARRSFDDAFAALLADARVSLFVATRGAAVVGLVTMCLRPALRLAATMATIDELVVAASARGSGIGAELVDAALAEARSRGAVRLELETRRSRESYARDFYRKQGFDEIDSAVFRRDLTEPVAK